MHPDALKKLFERQRIKEICIQCGSSNTTTGVHVDYNNGISVFEKYTCNRCSLVFFEKDLPR